MAKLNETSKTGSVAFDPGLSLLFKDISSTYNSVTELLNALPSFSRKQRMFSMYAPKIAAIFENNVCFYKGCMAWAFYIKNIFPDAKIKGNFFVKSEGTFSPAEYIDFLDEAIDDFTSNIKYYGVKGIVLPPDIKDVLSDYRNFTVINEGFANVLSVKDLKLSEDYSSNLPPEECEKLITEAINSKNISLLADL